MKYFLYCLAACMFIVIIWALCIKRTNGAKFSLAVQIPSLYMTIIFLSLVIAVNLNINNSTKLKRVEKVADTKEVIALNLDNSKEGRFFLGYGSVGNESYYVFYTKDNDDNINLQKVCSDEVTLKCCTDDETPKVEEYVAVSQKILTSKPTFWNNTFREYFLYKNYNVGDVVSETSATMRGGDIVKTVIHIPEGSIKNNYDVSLN